MRDQSGSAIVDETISSKNTVRLLAVDVNAQLYSKILMPALELLTVYRLVPER